MTDTDNGVFYLLPFFFQFPFIAHVLELTATTLIVDRAVRLDTVWRGRNNSSQFRYGIIFFDQLDPCPDGFSRQCTGDEYGKIFISPDTFPAGTQPHHGYFIDFPLLYGNRMFFLHMGPFLDIRKPLRR